MNHLRLAFIGFTCALMVLATAQAKPDRVEPKKTAPPKQINIAGDSKWGTIKQDGSKITIEGHEKWHVATGELRKDGKLFVLWIENETGRVGPGLYSIGKDGGIEGHWNWGTNAEVDAEGNWTGLTISDVLR